MKQIVYNLLVRRVGLVIFCCFLAAHATVGAQTNEPSVWTRLIPAGSGPLSRTTHGAAYDQANNRMMIFGGMGWPLHAPPLFNDSWVLTHADGTTGTPEWVQVVPTNAPPSRRAWASVVYDVSNNRLIVFGGNPNVGYCYVNVSDTWVLVNANGLGGPAYWVPLSPTNSPPAGRAHNSAVYDAESNRMIIFGGHNECAGSTDELWVLQNANGLGGAPGWTQIIHTNSPRPAPRSSHTAVLDPVTKRMIVFGGVTTNQSQEVWVLTNATSLAGQSGWQLLATSNTPPGRANHSAVYNGVANEMFVFGGDAPGMTNDVWKLTNANGAGGVPVWSGWFAGGAPPVARNGHSSILNVGTRQMVAYGGQSCNPNCLPLDDIWRLSLTRSLAPPVISSISPDSGSQGDEVTINGHDLRYVSTVAFNGQSAAFTNISDTEIRAWVPACAASGYLRVASQAGVGVSPTIFTVTRSAVTLSNVTEAELNAALCTGSSITFAADGAIAFTSSKMIAADLVIDGGSRNITLSGGNGRRLFSVQPGVQLTLRNITIADGLANSGGGIYNEGTVVAVNCTFTNNRALGADGSSGIRCTTGGPGTRGSGGAIFNSGGTLWLSNCIFAGNLARGGAGGHGGANGFGCGAGGGGLGGNAGGGAIYSTNGTLTLFSCSFYTNSCAAGNGGNSAGGLNSGGAGGSAAGGSLYMEGGSISAKRCLFLGSVVAGGNGGSPGCNAGGARGGALYVETAAVSLTDVTCSSQNLRGGTGTSTTVTMNGGAFGFSGGAGGSVGGGAIYQASGSLTISNATFDRQVLIGGNGGAGASASLSGGAGGVGGSALGGGVFLNSSSNVLLNVTCYSNYLASGNGGNQGSGGSAGGGRGGATAGGAIFNNAGTSSVINCTLAVGSLQGGIGGAPFSAPTVIRGANIAVENGALMLKNSIIAFGQSAPNCFGSNFDSGNNLCSDASANFTQPSSYNEANPYLGMLADNGGLTMTMAIAPPSAAIDGGDSLAAPASDQRSFARSGVADIGAFEYNGVAPSANLGLASFGPSQILVGSNALVSIIITNLGPLTASSTTVTSSWPGTLSCISAVASQGSYAHFQNRMVFSLGDLAPTGTVTILLTFTASTPGANAVSSGAGSEQADTAPSNNTSTLMLNALTASGDADGDQLPNWWEINQGLDPFSSLGQNGPGGDADGDGCNNYTEYQADTNPSDAASYPRVTHIAVVPQGIRIQWQAGNQSTQYLEGSFSLGDPNAWQPLFTNHPPTSTLGSYTNPVSTNTQMFYRLRLAR